MKTTAVVLIRLLRLFFCIIGYVVSERGGNLKGQVIVIPTERSDEESIVLIAEIPHT